MEKEAQDEIQIRQYLLGQLAEAEQTQIEERMMTDDAYFEWFLVVEDELIDEGASGALSAKDREGFDRYFLSTPERRERVMFSETLKAHINKPNADEAVPVTPDDSVPPIRPGWWKLSNAYVRLAAAAMVLLAVGLGVWFIFIRPSEVSKGLADLARAYRLERPTEARITKFDYAPFPVTRGGGPQKVDSLSLYSAERTLFDEARKRPSAELHHALGRLYLAERKFDDAIKEFDEALKTDPASAQLHSDYGALLMEIGKAERLKGGSSKSLEEFARSLEQLSKALDLNSSLLEALFNRALCQEYMFLYREAKQSWQDYIRKDSISKWADEARQKLKDLEERVPQTSQNREQLFQNFLDAYKAKDDEQAWQALNQNRNLTGSFIENRLIDDHFELALQGRREEASQRLDVLSYASELEYRQARDRFMLDLVRFYKATIPAQQKSISQARALMKSGQENYYKSNCDEAIRLYNEAKEMFKRADDVCEFSYMDFLIGQCYMRKSEAGTGLSILQVSAQAFEKAQYKRLLAQTFDGLAYGNQSLRDFSTAIGNTIRSLKLCEEMGDTTGLTGSIFQLADEYRFINNYQKAFDLHVEALSLALTYASQPAVIWRNYYSLSLSLEQLGQHAAAIDFQKEALQLAIEAERPRFICRSYNNLGLMLAKQGDYDNAAKNIERALEIGNSFPERSVRIDTIGYSFFQLGYVYRKSGNYSKAIENYDRAIQIYDELDSPFFKFTAQKGKLLCCMEGGECPLVESEMETLLNLFEQHRSKILEESNRNAFFDAEQSIYDVVIEFEQAKKGDSEKAFDYSERSRARSLHDLISTNAKVIDDRESHDIHFDKDKVSQPMGAQEIRARMPENARILQYAVLRDSLLIWVISKKEGLSSVSQPISAEDLNNRIRNYLQMITAASEKDVETISREAIYLYDLLIKPVEGLLRGNQQLCIVPDKILNYLPFGALVSQASGKYFIEEHGFVLSPSSNIFILSSDAARGKEALSSERLLSVGNPLFDSKLFDLPDLPSAAKEAETIARYYESSGLVIGAAATKRRISSEMEKADVIHLAMHAVADEWDPMRSKLLLANDGADASKADGVLQAHEVYNLNLTRARLVVLSACRTGVERYYGGEGMISLSRPFIAKRIPLVVASLWPVNSDSTARLMISFHRYRKSQHLPTAEALRQAQLEMLRDPDSKNRLPYNWASFVTIGGYASF